MFWPWMFLSMLGYAVASPVNVPSIREGLLSNDVVVRNSALEQLILGLLEELREVMITGADDFPVLDPLKADRIHLGEGILPIPNSHVTIKDLKVSKLATFVVADLSVNIQSVLLQRYRLDFEFLIPMLQAEAKNYDILIGLGGLEIFGNGDAKMNVTQPRITGSLLVAPRLTISGIFLTILDSDVSFTLKGFHSQINGLLDSDTLSDFVNNFLKHFIPELVEMYEVEITDFLSVIVQDIGNDLLKDLNLSDILG